MRKLKLAYLLAFAPMLMGADDDFASLQNGLVVNSLPTCGDTEYLTYTSNGLACTTITAGSLSVPDCQKDGQLLTFTMSGEIGVFSCTPKGSESLSTNSITTINNNYQDLVNLETTIRNLETGGRTPAAKYCGQTAGTKGAISTGNLTGLAAAAKLCEAATGCGTGARMCSVYDMYNSVANGTINSNVSISKSWVYMASWQNTATAVKEKTAGLADNCGSFTYPTADKGWDGTAVRWEPTDTGKYGLKFYTGNGPNDTSATQGAQCNYTFPIACCR